MTCQQYEADLVDLARGALGDGDADAATCEACAARLERERLLTEDLRTLSAMATVPANDVAERRLMMVFASARETAPAPDRRATIVRWSVWAAAACIFFFIGAWAAVEWRTRTASSQGTVETSWSVMSHWETASALGKSRCQPSPRAALGAWT